MTRASDQPLSIYKSAAVINQGPSVLHRLGGGYGSHRAQRLALRTVAGGRMPTGVPGAERDAAKAGAAGVVPVGLR